MFSFVKLYLGRERKSLLYLLILLIIFIISHFPFILKGFGEPDSARIAVSIIDRINHGPKGTLANLYFVDTVSLYVLCLTWVIRLLDNNYTLLPALMNYTNATFGTLTIIPAYLLIKKIFVHPIIAFYSLLVFIFAPSFYLASIYGFPHLIAFFFFLVSLCFYLAWLDDNLTVSRYLWLVLSSIALVIAFLFRSDIVLGCGLYLCLPYMKEVKEKKKIILSILFLILSLISFLLLRQSIIGPISGSSTSIANFLDWFRHFNDYKHTPSFYIKWQVKPVVFGTGVLTSLLGIIVIIFYLFRKRINILSFVFSWAALPVFFWLFPSGNIARHTMISVLPLIVIIIVFFYEKVHRYTIIPVGMLILGNFLITSPSSSTGVPSGNLFKSQPLLSNKIGHRHSEAKAIATLDEDKIVVIGYYHNPYILYEILRSTPNYDATKLSEWESFKIKTQHKEYLVFYTTGEKLDTYIEQVLNRYNLDEHAFVSVVDDLKWPINHSIKIRNFNIWK